MQAIEKIKSFIELIEGKKTYIIAAIAAILNLLVAFEVLSISQIDQINLILGSLGLAALRAGVKKV